MVAGLNALQEPQPTEKKRDVRVRFQSIQAGNLLFPPLFHQNNFVFHSSVELANGESLSHQII
jgi:hypothetical protein